MSERLFPILVGMDYELPEKIKGLRKAGGKVLVVGIPWSVIAPHEAQAQRNHGQSLSRLAERGGLSACEALAVIEDRNWHRVPFAEAHTMLAAHVAIRALQEPRP